MGIALKHLPESQRATIARSLYKVTSEDNNRGEIIGLCPIHGESNPSFSYNYKKDVYKCLSCNIDGDLLKLWSEVNGHGQKEGFKAFCTEYGIELKHSDSHSSSGRDLSPNDPPPELTHEQIITQMNLAWEKFPALPAAMITRLEKDRGWSRKWIEILDLRLETWRLSKKGELYQVKESVKIAIPIRDFAGNLINIRLYQPGAKQFKIISFAKTVGGSQLFPNKLMFQTDDVLLCEGESDTICAFSHDFNAITQTSKLKNWPPEHLTPFKGRDVVIAYDADQAGQKYALFAAQDLTGTAKSIRMLSWPAFMGVDETGAVPPDHGQDLTDFFVRHGKTGADLQILIDNASPWPRENVQIADPTSVIPSKDFHQSDDKSVEDHNDILQFWESGVNKRFSFKPRLLAEKLLQENKLMFDPKNGLLYRWNGKFWEEFNREYLEQSCSKYLRNESKKDKISDAAYQARILSTMPTGRNVNDQLDYICLLNGMLNINTFELMPHDPEYLATFALPVEFDPESEKRCDVFEQFLESSVQDKEAIAQLQEFAGYILSRDTKYEKCLFLLGPGRDGKSKFINAMKDMVGLENMSAVSFADLEKGFDRSSLYNKMLNTSTEIGNSVIESPYFKAITSGDPIQAAFKYVNNFTFIPYCKLLFAGNMLPRIKDNSEALMERLLIVKFPNQFLEGDPRRDVHLGDKLKAERSEIFYWALCGLKRLREQARFTDSIHTRKLLMDFRRSNNPILCFVEERCDLGEGLEVSKQDLYSEYDKYCRNNGYKPTNSNNFFRELYHAIGRLKIHQARSGESRARMAEGISIKPTEGMVL